MSVARSPEKEIVITPERKPSECRAVGISMPLADLCENVADFTSNPTASSSVSSSEPVREIDVDIEEPCNDMAQYETKKQGVYQCRWDVLSNYSSASDEECCSRVDSEGEEDVPHIPSERLSAHQRDRREHRLGMEMASRGHRGHDRPTLSQLSPGLILSTHHGKDQ